MNHRYGPMGFDAQEDIVVLNCRSHRIPAAITSFVFQQTTHNVKTHNHILAAKQ
jgi:hypothetical protein